MEAKIDYVQFVGGILTKKTANAVEKTQFKYLSR